MQRDCDLSRLHLPPALHAALLDHARATPGVEVCGLLGGRDEVALSLHRVANIHPEPETRFEMDPRGMLAAFRALRERGEALVGLYHSHPATPARPSARDLALAAYPGVAYLIVSLLTPDAPELAAFVFDGQVFSPLPLCLGPAADSSDSAGTPITPDRSGRTT